MFWLLFMVFNDNLSMKIGIVLVMSCSVYQFLYLERVVLFALISRIPLSDTEMDYLRVRSSDLGVNCNDIIELMNFECHSGASQVKF